MTEKIVEVGALPDEGPITVDIETPCSALAIAAHPDDAEFGCGGTLAKWAAAGCAVHHLILTDGSKGTWDEATSAAELVARRRDEQREAARRLGGGPVDFLDQVDGELEAGMAQRRAVCEVIRRVRPDAVLGHDPWRRYRLHPDHRNAGWLVVDGVVAAREPTVFPETGEAHRPRFLLLWEADEPNHVEAVGEAAAQAKVEALLAHRSQYRSTMGVGDGAGRSGEGAGRASATSLETEVEAFGRRVQSRLAEHGALAGRPAGEAFHLITDL